MARHSPGLDYTFDKLILRHPADEKTGGADTQVRTVMVCETSSGTSQK